MLTFVSPDIQAAYGSDAGAALSLIVADQRPQIRAEAYHALGLLNAMPARTVNPNDLLRRAEAAEHLARQHVLHNPELSVSFLGLAQAYDWKFTNSYGNQAVMQDMSPVTGAPGTRGAK